MFVYGLIDPRDGALRYVGKSVRGMKRPREHFTPSRLKENTHKAHWIKSVIRAGSRPIITILEEVSCEAALGESEVFHIAYLRYLGCDLTNATDGGEGASGGHPSASTRAKMSAAGRGRKLTTEHRAAISAALKGHLISQETRHKIGAKSQGNRNCEGRKLSEDSRAQMSKSVKRTSWVRGKKLPLETIEKMRAASTRRVRGPRGTFVKDA